MTFSRRGTLMPRDISIIQALYLTGALTTEQIARMCFPAKDEPNLPSKNSAKQRLHKLYHRGYLDSFSFRPPKENYSITIWTLSDETFRNEAQGHFDEQKKLRLPGKARIPHLLGTNDLYAVIASRMEELFGHYPIWGWTDEPRASHQYYFRGKPNNIHRPDAEIFLPSGSTFFIERQTASSKHKREEYDRKAEHYLQYLDYLGKKGEGYGVIFVCDTDRDIEHARAACREAGIKGTAGRVGDMAKLVLSEARKEEL